MIIISILLTFLFNTTYSYNNDFNYYIEKTNNQFNLINDYQVDMAIEIDIPAFRMPKKKYKVYYKRPNKIKVKSKGFGILPKTGLFTSPNDNFDNLKNKWVNNTNHMTSSNYVNFLDLEKEIINEIEKDFNDFCYLN